MTDEEYKRYIEESYSSEEARLLEAQYNEDVKQTLSTIGQNIKNFFSNTGTKIANANQANRNTKNTDKAGEAVAPEKDETIDNATVEKPDGVATTDNKGDGTNTSNGTGAISKDQLNKLVTWLETPAPDGEGWKDPTNDPIRVKQMLGAAGIKVQESKLIKQFLDKYYH